MSNNQNFESQVIEGLTDLTAKMNILVGKDGTNGRFGTLEAKVDEHDSYIQRQQGGREAYADRRLLWGGLVIGFANVAAILYHLTH